MHALRLFILLFVALAVAGCGLPDQYYLVPPIVGLQAPAQPFFQFTNPDHLNDVNINFSGFELWYKFFPDLSSINVNAYNANSTSDVMSQLTAAGFLRMPSGSDSYPNATDPVIPVQPLNENGSFTVQVWINPSGGNPVSYYTPLLSSNVTSGELRRAVQDSTPGYGYKNFLSNYYNYHGVQNYAVTDLDFGAALANSASTTGIVYLVVYAVSYGLIGISTPARSVPSYLGYIEVSITRP